MAVSILVVHIAAILEMFYLGPTGHFAVSMSQYFNEMSKGG